MLTPNPPHSLDANHDVNFFSLRLDDGIPVFGKFGIRSNTHSYKPGIHTSLHINIRCRLYISEYMGMVRNIRCVDCELFGIDNGRTAGVFAG